MTKRGVINMALDYLGGDAVDYNSTEITDLEKKAGRQYKVASLYVLQQADWIDAVANTTLSSEASITNLWNDYWEYVYSLPSGCLRALDLEFDSEAQFIVQGDYLYTNYYDATNGINLRYIKDIREETNNSLIYSDMLGEVIATRLAYNMAPVEKKGAFFAIFEEVLAEALVTNVVSLTARYGQDNPWWTDIGSVRTHRYEERYY